ncbi:MAG: aminotransferase class I/II-fold pyridoxal phosphate-dependent enzyme [Gemmatimonadota bacterium]
MQPFRPFEMERWQSTYEYRVDFNLSESGVHPLSVRELLDLAGQETADDTLLGYGQSNGSDELRAAVAALYPGASEAGVVVCNGSAEANFAAMWRLVRPGDEVVVVVPTYAQTIGLVQMLGGTVKTVPLQEENGWQPDPATIRAAVGDRTRVIVVTNPNNPTGALLSDEAREAVRAAAERSGAWIVADEVYMGAELSGRETPSFFGATERVVATGSLSKAYGLPGLRIGWTVSPPATREELWARTDYTTIAPGTLTDRLAHLALSPEVRPRLLERTRERIVEGLDILEAWMADVGVFSYRRPEAGAICYVKYDLPVGSTELAERLRAEHSVLVVPGDHFGMDGYVRFGIGNPPEELHAALERVGTAVRALRTEGVSAP